MGHPVTNTKHGIVVGVTSGLSAAMLTLAIAASIFVQNRVSPQQNAAADVLQTVAYNAVARDSACASGCLRTATGGVSAYDTLLLQNPFNATTGPTNGLHTATGALKFLQLDIISNPTNATVSCTVNGATNTATGGTLLLTRVSGTGTVATYIPSSVVTVGPTQYIKCGTITSVTSSFSAVLKGEFSESEVKNHNGQ